MSQSPDSGGRRPRYESGWDAINRMIREDGSWSGRERNCLHLRCDGDRFVDVSFAGGVDFIEDGRAFAVLDIEGDGDPDLLVRSRNGHRLRVVRNDLHEGTAPSARFELRGPIGGGERTTGDATTADAVGARVVLETDSGDRRIKHVALGSGFLSQSSRVLTFALPVGTRARARAHWPDGAVQEIDPVRAGFLYRLHRDGLRVDRVASAPARRQGLPVVAAPEPPQASPRTATWLLDPVPLPWAELRDTEGRVQPLPSGPALIVFLSIDCPLCRAELQTVRARAQDLSRSGIAVLGVSLDAPGRAQEVATWKREVAGPFPVVLATREAVLGWNVLHRHLWNRQRDLAVPLAFLLDGGRVHRIYRGSIRPDAVIEDAGALETTGDRRIARALPFAGTVLGRPFQRDFHLLGAAYTEAGLAGPAIDALRVALDAAPDDIDTLYNLGLAHSRAGDDARAIEAYERALELAPDFADALNNLGYQRARAGRMDAARDLFRRVVELQPEHTEGVLNLAALHIDTGDLATATTIYRDAIARDPENAVLHSKLAYALFRSGRVDRAVESYRRSLALSALELDASIGLANLLVLRGAPGDLDEASVVIAAALDRDPDNVALLNARGQLLVRQDRLDDARDVLRRALGIAPGEETVAMNLARVHLARGEPDEARRVLRALLDARPGSQPARALLEEFGGGAP